MQKEIKIILSEEEVSEILSKHVKETYGVDSEPQYYNTDGDLVFFNTVEISELKDVK